MSAARSRLPLFAANWKMNIGPDEAREFMREFIAGYPQRDDRRVVFFPPAVTLAAVRETLGGRADVRAGVQDIYFMENGAYTGALSASLAKAAGAEYTLVGHSERREVFRESDDDTRRKCRAALRAGLTPVLCVGESQYHRSEGRTAEVVGRQLRTVVSHLDASEVSSIMVAYEPIWAIGTGATATPKDASEVHHHIRFLLRQVIGPGAEGIHILYGGSVKPENAAELLAAPDVDGLLVGGASLKPDSWLRITTA